MKSTDRNSVIDRGRVAGDDLGSVISPELQVLEPPRRVPARSGLTWLVEGWELFREAPGTWVAIMLLWLFLSAVLAVVPLALHLLAPVLSAGMMLGCHSLARGVGLNVDHLFAGFKHRFRTLVMIGVVTLGATLLAVIVVMLLGTIIAGSLPLPPDDFLDQDASMILTGAPGWVFAAFALGGLFLLIAGLAITLAVWLAPALTVLNGLHAVPALLASLRAAVRNLSALTVYGAALLVLGVIASIPLGLGWLVLAPVWVTSTYAAYRDLLTE